jgi:hypothetical protein
VGEVETGIVGEHPAVELPQGRARVDAQLVAEQVADEHEAAQGFGLAPAAVERQHQLAPAPLP